MSSNSSLVKGSLRNISYTFIAQGIALAISLIKALWIPKMLGIEEFSYWQLFLFYSSYVGFFQFGLNDGIYLRYGGNKFENLDKALFRSQFWILVASQFILAIIVIVCSEAFIEDSNRVMILTVTSVCMVVTGVSAFFWFVFQSTNRIKEYTLAIVIEKSIFFVTVIILLSIKKYNFEYFIIGDVASRICGLIFCIFAGRELIWGKFCSYKIAFAEMISNISVGMKLMFANIASMLIIGVGRFMVDYKWGINAFGEFSLALSIVSMILLFINAVSIVLFPTLRRVSEDKLSETYSVMRTVLIMVLCSFLIFYIPIQHILTIWLPGYAQSLKYLAILFPLCVFDGKMQMLVSTYLKVLRKENVLLKINIIAVLGSLVACSFAAVVINNINFVIIAIVAVTIIRCVLAELYLSSNLNLSIIKNLIGEISLMVIFMLSSWYLEGIFSLLIYLIVYLIFVYFNKNDLKQALRLIKRVSSK
ncbi:oligosaccharide flippase family protein [Bacillus wiedmannii]|uniref:oligosaccharide flippase family protein n=1 Tax=Bacillus wiedmannii TaxID=1890302 RepID=UPI003D95D451